MANQIISDLGQSNKQDSDSQILSYVSKSDLDVKAIELAASRNFPTAMARLMV